jgi:hypothetical protein
MDVVVPGLPLTIGVTEGTICLCGFNFCNFFLIGFNIIIFQFYIFIYHKDSEGFYYYERGNINWAHK